MQKKAPIFRVSISAKKPDICTLTLVGFVVGADVDFVGLFLQEVVRVADGVLNLEEVEEKVEKNVQFDPLFPAMFCSKLTHFVSRRANSFHLWHGD